MKLHLENKQKFNSIDQTQVSSELKAMLVKIESSTKNFANEDVELNRKIGVGLDKIISKLKEKKPEAIKSVKTTEPKATKKKGVTKKTAVTKKVKVVKATTDTDGSKSQNIFARAKHIRKDGESFNDAKARASKAIQAEKTTVEAEVKTEMSKLLEMIKNTKELQGLSSANTHLERDGSRKAKPRGRRVSKDGNVYYENRENRTDRLSPDYPKHLPYFVDGGMVTPNAEIISADFLTSTMDRGEMFADGGGVGEIDAFTIKMVKGTDMKPQEVIADDHLIKLAKGGKLSSLEIYISEIAGLSGVRKEAIKKYISKHNLSDSEVLNIVSGLGRKQIEGVDVAIAIGGKENNSFSKKLIVFAKSEKAFRKEDGGRLKSALMRDRNNVNYSQDYEVRYSKNKEHRSGYVKPKISRTQFEEESFGFFAKGGSFLVKKENRVIADFDSEKEANVFMYEYALTNPEANLKLYNSSNKKEYAKGGSIAEGGEISEVAEAIFNSNSKKGKIETQYGDKTITGLIAMIENDTYSSKEIAGSIFFPNSKKDKIETNWGSKTYGGLLAMIVHSRNEKLKHHNLGQFAKGGSMAEGKTNKLYYHILEYGDYEEIGYQGYYENIDEAKNEVKKLSEYFPNQTFEIFSSTDTNEPPITTMAKGGSVGRFKYNVGDEVVVDDSGYTKSFFEFDISKPATILERSKHKMGGKTYYFYKIRTADGRTPFNHALEGKLTLVKKAEVGAYLDGTVPNVEYAKGGGLAMLNKELEMFDLGNLDYYELIEYTRFSKNMSKKDALQVIINTVEGDYTQLSPELAEIAEKQISNRKWNEIVKYIGKADIDTVTVKKNGKEVVYNGADVYNGANFLAKGSELPSNAFYVKRADVIKVTLKNGDNVKPVNGYWVKKSADVTTKQSKNALFNTIKFNEGDVVWDKGNKRYGLILNNFDDPINGNGGEVRLDSDGIQSIYKYDKNFERNGYNLIHFGEAEDKGNGNLQDIKDSAQRLINMRINAKDEEGTERYRKAYKRLLDGDFDKKMKGGSVAPSGKSNSSTNNTMQLAKEIRKDGEAWKDALKRAGAMNKSSK